MEGAGWGILFAILSMSSQIGKGLQKDAVKSLPELTCAKKDVVVAYLTNKRWMLGLVVDLFGAGMGLLSLGTLPMRGFTNGHTWFNQDVAHMPGAERPEHAPVTVHFTFQFGDTGDYPHGKRQRAREAALWAVDPPEYFTEGVFVALVGDTYSLEHKQQAAQDTHQGRALDASKAMNNYRCSLFLAPSDLGLFSSGLPPMRWSSAAILSRSPCRSTWTPSSKKERH